MKEKLLYISLVTLYLLGSGCHFSPVSSRQVFRFNMVEGLETTDPAFAKNQNIIWIDHLLFNTLIETDSNLNLVPSLARSWELSDSGKVYTFHLRTDVRFQDNPVFPGGHGRRMTASDVVYSFKRLVDPATASSGAWIFNGKVDPDSGFSAPNDSTFILRLAHPFRPILGILTMPYCSVVPHEVVEAYGKDFRSHPCGTGPFQLHSWDEGQSMILWKNPHYFQRDSSGTRLPYLDAVSIRFIDSKATEFLMFMQHQLDFMKDLDESYKDEILTRSGKLRLEFRGSVVLTKKPFLNTQYVGLLVDTSLPVLRGNPIRQLYFRKALNEGFDRDQIAMFLKNNVVRPATAGFVPAGLPSFNPAQVPGYTYNPSLARMWLGKAGFGPGKPAPSVTLYSAEKFEDIADFMVQQWQQLGIHARVMVQQVGMLRDMAAKAQTPAFMATWIADYPDAESFLACFYSKNPAPPNYTHYSSPLFDRWYEQSLKEPSDSLRYRLYNRMDSLVMSDAPVIPVLYDESLFFTHPDVEGLQNNSLNLLELRWVRIKQEKK